MFENVVKLTAGVAGFILLLIAAVTAELLGVTGFKLGMPVEFYEQFPQVGATCVVAFAAMASGCLLRAVRRNR